MGSLAHGIRDEPVDTDGREDKCEDRQRSKQDNEPHPSPPANELADVLPAAVRLLRNKRRRLLLRLQATLTAAFLAESRIDPSVRPIRLRHARKARAAASIATDLFNRFLRLHL